MKTETIQLSTGEEVVLVWMTKRRYVRITKNSVEVKKWRKR